MKQDLTSSNAQGHQVPYFWLYPAEGFTPMLCGVPFLFLFLITFFFLAYFPPEKNKGY